MIDHERRICFVHIPKTGGRSIERALDHEVRRCWDPPWHAPASAYREQAAAGYLVFAVVRNPWDRLVSLNHYLTGHGQVVPTDCLLRWATLGCRAGEPAIFQASQRAWLDAPVDRLLRFERLEADWAALATEIGAPAALPHENGSTGRLPSYREYFDARQARLVRRLCRWDCRAFGYRF